MGLVEPVLLGYFMMGRSERVLESWWTEAWGSMYFVFCELEQMVDRFEWRWISESECHVSSCLCGCVDSVDSSMLVSLVHC